MRHLRAVVIWNSRLDSGEWARMVSAERVDNLKTQLEGRRQAAAPHYIIGAMPYVYS